MSAVEEKLTELDGMFAKARGLAKTALNARPDAAVAVSVNDRYIITSASVDEAMLQIEMGHYGAMYLQVFGCDERLPQTFTDVETAVAAWVAVVEATEAMQ